MTGLHTGKTPIRDNGEWGERGNVWSFKAMLDNPELEGQRPMPDSIITVAQVLKNNGYKTGMVGKWGLGAPNTNSIPNEKGFDFFYGYNCQRIAHSYYPTHLWKNKEREYLDNYLVEKNEDLAPDADIYDEKSYSKYNQKDYTPTLMHNEALNFIETNKDENFFLYYASLIPHLALQAPKKWEDYYRKKFGKEEPFTGKSYYPSMTPKATYAAMISYLDEQVGEIVLKLKEIGEYENTLIIFTSDNGPSFLKEVDLTLFESTSFLNSSRDRVKGSMNEGGIRVPMIASWPNVIKKETKTNHISSFQDFYATVCDILKVDPPYQIDGLSFYPTLKDEKQSKHEYLYWEIAAKSGQQGIRYGKWKGIKKNLQNGKQQLKLYNLDEDILELNDIAEICGLGGFYDLPLGTYSAGMRAKFVMALLTILGGEIMAIDEWIGTVDRAGKVDQNFYQKKVLEIPKIIFLASHSEAIIKSTTNKCLWLEKGEVVEFGETEKVFNSYSRHA